MTKQEKIREEVESHIGACLRISDMDDSIAGSLSKSLMVLQDGLGLVIKREDNSYVAPCLRDAHEEIKQDMKEVGYELVEPLIEEV